MNNNFFEVLRAGINTTYQDKGRFHMQHLGVAPGGCMDLKSFSIANALVGNNFEEGVIDPKIDDPANYIVRILKNQDDEEVSFYKAKPTLSHKD